MSFLPQYLFKCLMQIMRIFVIQIKYQAFCVNKKKASDRFATGNLTLNTGDFTLKDDSKISLIPLHRPILTACRPWRTAVFISLLLSSVGSCLTSLSGFETYTVSLWIG
ncbi:hypothetical protein CG427_15725 [Pantoea ananatis]|nr:hypothetical protein CG427_15725 [Pantoea ananatis]